MGDRDEGIADGHVAGVEAVADGHVAGVEGRESTQARYEASSSTAWQEPSPDTSFPAAASEAATETSPDAPSDDPDDLPYSIYEQPDREGLFDGDQGDLPPEARYALTRLVRDRYVSDEAPGKYRTSTYSLILQYRDDLQRNLNNLCMTLNINEKYRVAWASTAPFDGNMPGVVIKRAAVQRRDVTLLLITLRIAALNAELDGRDHWYIDRADIDNAFVTISPYADEGDATLVRRRIDSAISEARTLGYLEDAKTAQDRYRILPVVPAIMTLERTTELVEQLRELTQSSKEN